MLRRWRQRAFSGKMVSILPPVRLYGDNVDAFEGLESTEEALFRSPKTGQKGEVPHNSGWGVGARQASKAFDNSLWSRATSCLTIIAGIGHS